MNEIKKWEPVEKDPFQVRCKCPESGEQLSAAELAFKCLKPKRAIVIIENAVVNYKELLHTSAQGTKNKYNNVLHTFF